MTLTATQIADGWKPHDGGKCPVALDSKPGVQARDGYVLEPGIGAAGAWCIGINNWEHEGKHREYDIIAYKEQNNDRPKRPSPPRE